MFSDEIMGFLVVLVLVLIGFILCGFYICLKWSHNKNKERKLIEMHKLLSKDNDSNM